jgi:hypothetical protein
MASSALLALRPGTPAVLSELSSKANRLNAGGELQTVTLVRPFKDDKDTFLCRLPKSAKELREKYKVLVLPASDLHPVGEPENLLDGSLFPSESRPRQLKVQADFVTCTQ